MRFAIFHLPYREAMGEYGGAGGPPGIAGLNIQLLRRLFAR
jgi:hypothetical protein